MGLPYTNSFFVEIFKSGKLQKLDLMKAENSKLSQEIEAREVATEKSVKASNVEEMLNLQGSPGINILNETIQRLCHLGIIPRLSGVGIELGAGSGALSRVLIESDFGDYIDGIVALEIIKPFVDIAIPRLKSEMKSFLQNKLIPAHGSFNSISVPDETFDFGLQIESFHHSDSLDTTIKETYRVLKRDAIFLSIDRSWVNSISTETINELLNHEYSELWLREKGFPKGVIHTRRENGEHEYRDNEWIKTFESNGFTLINHYYLVPKIRVRDLIKRIICILGLDKAAKIKIKSRGGVIRTFLYRLSLRRNTFKFGLIEVLYPRPLQILILKKTNN